MVQAECDAFLTHFLEYQQMIVIALATMNRTIANTAATDDVKIICSVPIMVRMIVEFNLAICISYF